MIRSRFFHIVILSLAAVAIPLCVAAGLMRHLVSAPFALEQDSFLYIAPGQSISAAAEEAHALGLVRKPVQFRLAVRWLGMEKAFHAGEYRIENSDSILILFNRIRHHETYQRRVAVPEGVSVKEVAILLGGAFGLDTRAMTLPQEGSLLPDTYFYQRGDTGQAVLARMQRAMTETLAALWETRAPDLPFITPEEALVLASIVEKETAVPSERPQVAAVFVNRLKRGMRLQSDPTVIYGITGGLPLDRPISRADLRQVTAHNTYRVDGLPPTPISNPGIDSIRAVLNPADVPYLYFVADGSGGHAFASSLQEHNQNVARWRRLQQGSR
jgi:UPF0755 protein